MSTPLHQYASVPLAADPGSVHRLLSDPRGLVSGATADALTAVGPQVRGWGLEVTGLPVAAAAATGAGELGTIEVVWSGPEDLTGWPALTARIVVVPSGASGSRVTLLSSRSPGAELATGRVGGLHRRRLVDVSIQRFLLDLARRLDDPGSRPSTADPAGPSDAPTFLHHLQELHADPHAVRDRLRSDLQGLAQRTTAAAVTRSRPILEAGRFRGAASPIVRSSLGQVGDVVCARIGWRGDEEASGWPQLDLSLLVEAHPTGSRLAVLSTREPGYDLSVPRVDKQQRDQLVRSVGPNIGAAIRDELADLPDQADTAEVTTGRRLVA